MARIYDRLSPTTVKAKELAPGRYPDGGNLYLNVGREGQRRWTFLYKERVTGRACEMGLGSAGKAGVTLAEARRKAAVEYVQNGIESGALKPVIDRTFKFDDMAEVHRYLESSNQFGKIVVTV